MFGPIGNQRRPLRVAVLEEDFTLVTITEEVVTWLMNWIVWEGDCRIGSQVVVEECGDSAVCGFLLGDQRGVRH